MGREDTMRFYVEKFRTLILELKLLGGEAIPDRQLFDAMIKGVTNYIFSDAIKEAIRWDKEKKTFETICNHLIAEEEDVILLLPSKSSQEKPPPLGMFVCGDSREKTCFYCGEKGHIVGSWKKWQCKRKIANVAKDVKIDFLPGLESIQPPYIIAKIKQEAEKPKASLMNIIHSHAQEVKK
jgi:hypothetical protein